MLSVSGLTVGWSFLNTDNEGDILNSEQNGCIEASQGTIVIVMAGEKKRFEVHPNMRKGNCRQIPSSVSPTSKKGRRACPCAMKDHFSYQ
ncbi:hypothetical protein PoB_005982700 [Plakobranchus ocellatus]|uniref:Uncharacterized protein n=1 Tax=Plakobranchus ocellatus TaxID=259542 RepID=A0AAV4CN31_9GAST|nr:hypothetical protein PoB_005982700 [Plakobranchus ocellatus]